MIAVADVLTRFPRYPAYLKPSRETLPNWGRESRWIGSNDSEFLPHLIGQ